MVRICGLEKLSGGRYLVRMEDGTEFPMPAGDLERYGICVGGELDGERLTYIMEEVLPPRAEESAVRYLGAMDRTEQQLRRKLETLSYPPRTVELAMEYVRSLYYIDDVRYAVNYIESQKGGKGLRRIAQELYQRGVSEEDFQEALLRTEAPDEEQQIRGLLEKRHYPGAQADAKERDRTIRFLLRRGYGMPAVLHVLGTGSF